MISIIDAKRRTLVVHQQENHDVQALAQHYKVDSQGLCGFLSLAVATTTTSAGSDNDDDDHSRLLHRLESVLQWIVKRRQEYIETHPTEFVPPNTSWKESHGRTSQDQYRQMMCSAVEIAAYLEEFGGESIATPCITFLRTILEGPIVNDDSIRFGSSANEKELLLFVSQEDAAYVAQERQFYNEEHPVDYYMQIAKNATTNNSQEPCFVSVDDWVTNHLFGALTENEDSSIPTNATTTTTSTCWNVIIDGHGHFMTLQIQLEQRRKEGDDDDNKKDSNSSPTSTQQQPRPYFQLILHEYDTLPKEDDDNNSSTKSGSRGYKGVQGCEFLKQTILHHAQERFSS